MGFGEMLALAAVESEMQEANDIAKQQLNTSREAIVQELIRDGILLPHPTWDGKEINKKTQAIVDEWFSRHPETKQGTGVFQKKYPHVINARKLLFDLLNKNRISEKEFFTLIESLYKF